MSKAVLLLNLGTPAAPTTKGLREYYRHFFADPYVFDFNPLGRWLLRNLIILPFRAPRVAKDYEKIWMEGGSPLKVYAERLEASVQAAFDEVGEDVKVCTAMNYSQPLVRDVMADLEAAGVREILVLPMYPQYSSATTASIFAQVREAAQRWHVAPQLYFVNDLYAEPAFVRAWSIVIAGYLEGDAVDHVIFSYHGVPEKTIRKEDKAGVCEFGACCEQIGPDNRYCYRAQCVQTTENIARALGWKKDDYSIAFQSRFGPLPWLQPYLDEHLEQLVKDGVRRVAVVTPSFVSDCLETLFEIGVEYREQYLEAGGENFALVPNLNDDPAWFAAVHEIAAKHLAAPKQ
ncbi:MAG: ferrochelatase [Pseudohongiellaceae bacterium]